MAKPEWELNAEKLIATLESLSESKRPAQGEEMLRAYRSAVELRSKRTRDDIDLPYLEASLKELEHALRQERRTAMFASFILLATIAVAIGASLLTLNDVLTVGLLLEDIDRVLPWLRDRLQTVLFLIPAIASLVGLFVKVSAEKRTSKATGEIIRRLKDDLNWRRHA